MYYIVRSFTFLDISRLNRGDKIVSGHNIAIVGCGQLGLDYVRNFAELGALHSVFDLKSAPLKTIHHEYPNVNIKKQFSEALLDKDINGVVIVTPPETHYNLAKSALEAGKDVLVDRPLALRVEEGESLVELAEKQGCILMIGDGFCYHPAVVKLREIIKAGDLGRIYYIYSSRLNAEKFRIEEKNIFRCALQDFFVVLLLLEDTPVLLSVRGGNCMQAGKSSVIITAMEFASGVQTHFFANYLHPKKEEKLIIMGDRGVAVFGNGKTNNELILCNNAVSWVKKAPFPSSGNQRVVKVIAEEPLKRECQEFLECVEHRQVPRIDGKLGLQELRILEACQHSLRECGKTITLGDGKPAFYVHETSIIDNNCSIGKGTKIWHFCHLMPGVTIGERCVLGQNTFVGRGVSIGSNVKIQNNVSVYEGVVIEDDVFCGPSCVFTHIINPRAHIPRRDKFLPTLVKQGATIGANSTILGGLVIGKYAFVGAGAVVTRDVPDYALVHGNPARFQGWRCQCGEELSFNKRGNARCSTCRTEYSQYRSGTEVAVRLSGSSQESEETISQRSRE
jgi:UDP-2-acetamido-3-amino-2,3-dideoxy-glucuronate N-acetyltransferase